MCRKESANCFISVRDFDMLQKRLRYLKKIEPIAFLLQILWFQVTRSIKHGRFARLVQQGFCQRFSRLFQNRSQRVDRYERVE